MAKKPPPPLELNLALLQFGIGGLIPEFTALLGVSAAWCFQSEKHKPGVKMSIRTNNGPREATMKWQPDSIKNARPSFQDINRTTDDAAMGVALLMVAEFTSFKVIETTATGPGFDFILRENQDDDDFNFLAGTGLECSGIRHATGRNNLDSRLAVKKKQVKAAVDSGTTCYFGLVEFSRPSAIFATT